MILKIFLYYIIGYIRIEVEGFYIERFMNTCMNNNIFIWNIKRNRDTTMYCNVGINDFKNLKKICKITNCKIKIEKKKGLPFKINKYKKRKIFMFLLLFILCSIFILSRFVWNIEINGDIDINKEELLSSLKESGLNIGMLKNKVDTQKIIEEIRLKRDDIAWIGIDISGTNAIVEIVQASPKPEILDKNEYCNIVSDKTGIITKINITNGTAEVKVGDAVEEGTVLARGWMEGKYTGIRYVHATGEIQAKTWYTKEKEAKYKEEVTERTGKVEVKNSIKINNFKINFNKKLSKFKLYDTINENKKLKIFNNFYLPIEFKKTTNYELKTTEKNYDLDTLRENTITSLEEEIKLDIEGKEIVNRDVVVEEKEDGIKVKLIYEVLENIGVEEKLVL